MNITLIIIAVTAIISVLAFNNHELFSRLQFNAYQVYHRKQYYRLITHGFVHAGWWHLFLNMLVLFFFGQTVEAYLGHMASQGIIKFPMLTYLIFYFSAMVFASSISLFQHKDNAWYNAVGASGAVSAVLFFSIFFDPWRMIRVYFVPVPGIVFAVLYVIYSHYQSKKGQDNIAHDAHLLGALYGFVFPLFLDLQLIKHFISQLLGL